MKKKSYSVFVRLHLGHLSPILYLLWILWFPKDYQSPGNISQISRLGKFISIFCLSSIITELYFIFTGMELLHRALKRYSYLTFVCSLKSTVVSVKTEKCCSGWIAVVFPNDGSVLFSKYHLRDNVRLACHTLVILFGFSWLFQLQTGYKISLNDTPILDWTSIQNIILSIV